MSAEPRREGECKCDLECPPEMSACWKKRPRAFSADDARTPCRSHGTARKFLTKAHIPRCRLAISFDNPDGTEGTKELSPVDEQRHSESEKSPLEKACSCSHHSDSRASDSTLVPDTSAHLSVSSDERARDWNKFNRSVSAQGLHLVIPSAGMIPSSMCTFRKLNVLLKTRAV